MFLLSCFVLLFTLTRATIPYLVPLLPTSVDFGYHNSSFQSWGGNIVYLPSDPTWKYHGFFAAFINNCGLSAWGSNSVVIHAGSNSLTSGFQFIEIVLDVWHHNPQISVAPDGTFILWSIGSSPEPKIANCSKEIQEDVNSPSLQHGFETMELHYATSIYGPWTLLPGGSSGYPFNSSQFNGTNPAPWFLPNGTAVVASHDAYGVTVSVADSWRGPYSLPSRLFLWDGEYVIEDPFLWFDSVEDKWKCLFHQYNKTNTKNQIRVGGYAESNDSNLFSTWTLQPNGTPAYNTSVLLNDGTTLVVNRRERPKLYFENGVPVALFTGVQTEKGDTYSLFQPIQH
jgi:alpha-L-fucosidase